MSTNILKTLPILGGLIVGALFLPNGVFAHCDGLDGPVAAVAVARAGRTRAEDRVGDDFQVDEVTLAALEGVDDQALDPVVHLGRDGVVDHEHPPPAGGVA